MWEDRAVPQLGYRKESEPILANICTEAESKLFSKVQHNDCQRVTSTPLSPASSSSWPALAPEIKAQSQPSAANQNLKQSLSDRNFFIRSLYKDLNYMVKRAHNNSD
jgi:hypothetical protein